MSDPLMSDPLMSSPLTNYYVNGTDLFSGVSGPGQPVGAAGYNVINTNLFTYYTNQGVNYQSNLSRFNYIYQGTPFDIMLYNYFTKATIGTPANATFSKINNRLCWKITNNTTVNLRFPNNTTINFVAVGGGQIGGQGSNNGSGGYGGGVVRGQLIASGNNTLTITIGSSGTNTTIAGTNISITANTGPGTGTTSGSNIVGTPTTSQGGIGGIRYIDLFTPAENGGNGPFISDLGIYVAGGGGGGGANTIPYYSDGGLGGAAGGGNGAGGNPYSAGTSGSLNTGGGGGGNSISSSFSGNNDGGPGGSGVVYLYL